MGVTHSLSAITLVCVLSSTACAASETKAIVPASAGASATSRCAPSSFPFPFVLPPLPGIPAGLPFFFPGTPATPNAPPSKPGLVGGVEPPLLFGITQTHNQARASIATSPTLVALAWSPDLANEAQATANRCAFAHSKNGHGENLYAATDHASPQGVVGAWMSEQPNYDYATNQCSGACGHYTQIVSRRTQRVGCGVARCSSNSPFPGFTSWELWVCNYDPAGTSTTRPY